MSGFCSRTRWASVMAWAARSSRCASPSSSTNSSDAPSNLAAAWASATRCSGVPCVPASPFEQTTRCTRRPARASKATMPPQPNSISSGWAPKTKSGPGSELEFGVGFIGSLDRLSTYEVDLGRVRNTQVVLFARARDIVRALHDRLHPFQSGVAGRVDLPFNKRNARAGFINIAPFVEQQFAFDVTGPDNFTLVGHVDIVVVDLACRFPKGRIARAHNADALQESHPLVHLEAEIGDVPGVRLLERLD